MGRPTKGVDHVDGLQGDLETRWVLKVVLSTLTGEMLVEEAYEELGLGPTQFANLRKQALQAALDGLRPKPIGRPKRLTTCTEAEVDALRRRIAELEREAQLQRARLEVALLPLLDGGTTRSKRRGPSAPSRPPTAP
jgi:hypothetical protein